ncbi:MAG: hypothetical protein CTY15_08375 [Methylocystis sp.]|nr:MAG: hypothetical protein CTY15_08375 [Methylocystis sp.]
MPHFIARFCIILTAVSAFSAPAVRATTITPQGVGPVKLGARYADLQAKGLVGPIGPGCELAGPNTRAAKLRPPLKGSVDFTLTEPRRAATITVNGGATARGVGVGSTSRALKTAFPAAKFDHSSDEVFLATFVRVPRSGGGPIAFAVSTKTKRVQQIAIPNLAVCE